MNQTPRCRFYPDSCAKEYHGSREPHVWKDTVKPVRALTESEQGMMNRALFRCATVVERPSVALDAVTHSVTHTEKHVTHEVTNAQRQAKWRAANKDKQAVLQRDRMKRLRQKKSETA